jgi:hypothetical protein
MTEKRLIPEEVTRIKARIDELSDVIGEHMAALEKGPAREERLAIWVDVRRDMTEWRELSDLLLNRQN